MNTEVIQLLDKVLKSRGQSLKKSNEYMWWSPFTQHHKPKLQVNIQTGKWHCWVSNQGGHNLYQLFKKVGAGYNDFKELNKLLGDVSFYKKDNDTTTDDVRLPQEYKSLSDPFDTSLIKEHAIRFLRKRGITKEDIIRYNLGYCSEGKYNNRIIIPSYDSRGQLNYFVGRDFYSSNFKYMNPPNVAKDVIGFDLYVNWSLPIILVEGVFDAMSVKSNSIPLFGKTILPKLYKKIVEKKVKDIFIILDSDAFDDAIRMTEKFVNEGINVNFVKLNGQDPNDLGYKKMITKINNSLPMDFKQIMEMKLYGKKLLAN
jgi:DNA primase